MRPLIATLCDQAYVIAPDTPGYGLSEPLTDDATGLAPFVNAFIDLIRGLKLVPIVYGSSTGAQIAIELAKAHPEALAGVLLDNAAHFEDAERQRILSRYFPDRTPTLDGAHLAGHWLGIRNLSTFFPWFDESAAAKLKGPAAPLAMMQMQLLDQLRSGQAYSRAYRAAFENEKVENLLPIKRPTRIIRWQGSMLWHWMQAFDQVRWPDPIQLIDCGPTSEQRMQAIRTAFADLAASAEPYQPIQNHFAERLRAAGAAWSRSDETKALHWRGCIDKKVCLLLHDLGSSSNCFKPLLKDGSPFLAVDLPGHGVSGEATDILAAATQIATDLKALEVAPLCVAGIGLGAAIASQLTQLISVKHLLAIDARAPADLPALQPAWSGAHLQELWYALKDRCLYYPWNQRTPENRLEDVPILNPEQLQDELLDMLISANNLASWHRQLSAFDWGATLQRAERAHWRTPTVDSAQKMPGDIHLWAEHLTHNLQS